MVRSEQFTSIQLDYIPRFGVFTLVNIYVVVSLVKDTMQTSRLLLMQKDLTLFIIFIVEVGQVQTMAVYRSGGQRRVVENGSNSQFMPIIWKKKWCHVWIVGTVSPEKAPVVSLGRGKARILSSKSCLSFLQGPNKTSHSKKSRLSVDSFSQVFGVCTGLNGYVLAYFIQAVFRSPVQT